MGEKRRRSRHQAAIQRPMTHVQRGRVWWVAGIAAVAAVAAAFILADPDRAAMDGPAIDRAAILAAELKHPTMLEVERRFVCPCGRCGELELVECVCDGPGGAMEMKTALARVVSEGLDADEATARLATRFGGLKPREEWSARRTAETVPGDGVPALAPAHREATGAVGAASGSPSAMRLPADPLGVVAVTSGVRCPCGNCSHVLVDCSCGHPGG